MCSGRKRWCTEQWPFQRRKVDSLMSASVEAAELLAGVPHPHVVLGEADGVAGVAAEVLVGEEQHLRPPAPVSAKSPSESAHSSTARALVEVHTAPPCSPTKAFRAAEEFM